MIPLHKALSTAVGKKLVMALTGLALVFFAITHLLGNLSLYKADGATFNLYAATLESYGPLLTIAEVGLAAVFVLHIVLAFEVKRSHISARPTGYKGLKTKGGQSLNTIGSRNMIITGVVLMLFLVLHVWQFRLGPSIEAGYTTQVKGVQIRDLHRLVHETFKNPLYVAVYTTVMLFLGLHLRHGFWSAFQSLGALNARFTRPVYALGGLIAILIAVGFFFMPLWIYFDLSKALFTGAAH